MACTCSTIPVSISGKDSGNATKNLSDGEFTVIIYYFNKIETATLPKTGLDCEINWENAEYIYIFNGAEELYLWRRDENTLKGRIRKKCNDANCTNHSYQEHNIILSGTRNEAGVLKEARGIEFPLPDSLKSCEVTETNRIALKTAFFYTTEGLPNWCDRMYLRFNEVKKQ